MIRRAQQFFQWEGASGVLLLGAALLALFAANSPLAPLYDQLLTLKLGLHFGESAIIKPLVLWINDGLMAVFFMLVALEIKREVLEGELSSLDRVALPTIAAVGGMAVPAVVYTFVTWGDPVAMNGWAIPAATDIAFAVGILALLGKRVPSSLKLFLLTLAVVDDLGAVVIIALFYTSKLAPISLLIALGALAVLVALNRMRIRSTAAYILVGVVAWFAVLNSGVHATLAGVAVGLIIPHGRDGEPSMLRHLEHNLQPWVAFFIVPVFAFANAGVTLQGLPADALIAPVPLAIALGLFLGKQAGVFGFSWLAIKLGWARLPQGANWRQLYGVALLTGIGFTMSLFIASLAFEDQQVGSVVVDYRLGILVGSAVSAIAGYLALRAWAPKGREAEAGNERSAVASRLQ